MNPDFVVVTHRKICPKTLRISILSNPRNLFFVREKIRKRIARAGFSKINTVGIVLAVNEACANIIRHSYQNNHNKKINIYIQIKNGYLWIKIHSYGIKPDIKKIEKHRPRKMVPGGLGLFLMKKIMDGVRYDTKSKRVTKLTLTKRLPLSTVAHK